LGELPCQLAPEKRKNEKKIENIENPLEDGAVTAPTAMGQLLRQQRWGSYCANSDGAVTAPTAMGQLLRQQRWGSYCANNGAVTAPTAMGQLLRQQPTAVA
jgi:hypothetical protein